MEGRFISVHLFNRSSPFIYFPLEGERRPPSLLKIVLDGPEIPTVKGGSACPEEM
jgi:hypothetical protein